MANITVETITEPTLAAITWRGRNTFFDDLVVDQNAVRNASFGSAEFTTTVAGLYTEFTGLNISGSIDTTQICFRV